MTTRQPPTLQIRAGGWQLAHRLAHALDQKGYRFTDAPFTDLVPGQYTGKPLGPKNPGSDPRPWLVAWWPRPEPEGEAPRAEIETGARFAATLNNTWDAFSGLGRLLAAFCIGALAIRLLADPLVGVDGWQWDIPLAAAGLYVGYCLLLSSLTRCAETGIPWRRYQQRLGLWILARANPSRAETAR